MKKLIIALFAAAALAVPASAAAHHGHYGHHWRVGVRLAAFEHGMSRGLMLGWGHEHSFAELSGTGSSFAADTANATGSIVGGNDHPNGHFGVDLATTWSSATTKTWTDNDGDADDGTVTVSCAPATANVTLSNGSTSTSSLTGKTCSLTRDGTTRYGFAGVSSDGKTRAFLREDGTTVTGAVINGLEDGEGCFFGFGFHH